MRRTDKSERRAGIGFRFQRNEMGLVGDPRILTLYDSVRQRKSLEFSIYGYLERRYSQAESGKRHLSFDLSDRNVDFS